MNLNILIASSNFNAGPLATEMMDHIVQGVRAILPDANFLQALSDEGGLRSVNLDQLLERADLVITADCEPEAGVTAGNASAEWVRRAKDYGIPVIALAGNLGSGVTLDLQQP